MPSLAALHPQVVHFVVALIIVGVAFRCLSLVVRAAWLNIAAVALIALGAIASLAAVKSGTDAHGPVERVPGARSAVVEHEEWGERARNAFLILLAVEVVAAALGARQNRMARPAAMVAAVVGIVSVGVLYKAADAGGALVYSYAGGVGIRSGDPADVGRLLVAAAHHQAALDRTSGRALDAAGLIDMVAARFPNQLELQLAQVDSVLTDRKDPQGALNRLGALQIPSEDTRLRIRAGILRANALAAMGDTSAARQVLETLRTEFPTAVQIQRRIAELAPKS